MILARADVVIGSRASLRWLCVLGCAAAACRPPSAAVPEPVARFRAVSGGARWDAGFEIATRAAVAVGEVRLADPVFYVLDTEALVAAWRAVLGGGEIGARHTVTVEPGQAGAARSHPGAGRARALT
jgi:hypothetical protein